MSAFLNPTGAQMPGTNTNDNATAGNIGEYLISQVLVGASVSLSTGSTSNVTSLSLTAGDWDCWGIIVSNPNGLTTSTGFSGAITTTSATLPTAPNFGAYNSSSLTLGAGIGLSLPIPTVRISLGAPASVFLVAQSTFAVSTMGVYGALCARRAR